MEYSESWIMGIHLLDEGRIWGLRAGYVRTCVKKNIWIYVYIYTNIVNIHVHICISYALVYIYVVICLICFSGKPTMLRFQWIG